MRVSLVRKSLYGWALGAALLVAPTFWGCGNGSNNSNPGFQATRNRGVVQMPAGVSKTVNDLAIAAPNASQVQTDGTFEFDKPTEGESLVVVGDKDGKPILAGFTEAGKTDPVQLNAQSTAVALLFYGSGAFTLPQDQHDAVRKLIAAHPAVAPLATTLTQRLAANPNAIAGKDPPLQTAIQTALDAMKSGTRRAIPATTGRTREDPTLPAQLLAQPSEAQSGVIVGASDDLTGLQIVNTRRRNLLLFIQQTGYEDAQGAKHDIDLPVVQAAFPSDWVPSTNKLAGAIGSVVDVIAGNGAYQPVKTKPIPLPVKPATAKKSFYRVTLAGPGLDPGATPKQGAAAVKTAASEMLALSFAKDIFLPLFFSALDIHLNINELLNQQGLFESAKGLLSIAAAGGHVGVGLTSFEPKEVVLSIIKAMADDYVFRQAILNWLTEFLIKQSSYERFGSLVSANFILTKLSFILAVIDKGMALGDASVAAYDWGQSDYFEEWEVTAIPPVLKINPNEATVYNVETQSLKLQTQFTGNLVYHWKTDATLGNLVDVKANPGNGTNELTTTSPQITYVGSKTPPDGDGVVETVTCEVSAIPADNPSGPKTYLGKATAKLTRKIKKQVPLAVTDKVFEPWTGNTASAGALAICSTFPIDDKAKFYHVTIKSASRQYNRTFKVLQEDIGASMPESQKFYPPAQYEIKHTYVSGFYINPDNDKFYRRGNTIVIPHSNVNFGPNWSVKSAEAARQQILDNWAVWQYSLEVIAHY